MLSASIISGHESTLSGNAKLAIFIPILAGMGGNVGTQSSTITVRNIAVSDIKGFDVFKTILHEMSVGLLVGFSVVPLPWLLHILSMIFHPLWPSS